MARPKTLHGRLDDVAEALIDAQAMLEELRDEEMARRVSLARRERARRARWERHMQFLATQLHLADDGARDVRRLAGREAYAAGAEIAAAA